ncbi:DNA-binding protein [Alteromonas sp. KUL42]|uniref:YheV family putative zinc ribbon protein n=1 Tax=Alteromonas sp. KUL42 TaxID=2480797 RepID=UPI00079441C2|nr:YheV family putative zinc ribbon protein [Alteromonas sp. KUL42]KXJ58109.1 MAG: DNA-binding protein [Alteromonas sp. Nap_26]TAP32337.1 YheV family putative metal-binding protein [Alteromonas sp. KUL42]GEA08756.1 DNA-binding protein [Alteromonas sp. KUL42]
MSNRVRRRFVAGATCPKCQELDTISLYFENNVEKLECVSCGYKEAQTDEKVSAVTRENESVIGIFKPH